MRFLARAILLVFLVAATAVGGVFAAGPEKLWARFGAADQGAVDFASLRRRTVANDSLACSPRTCSERVDVALPNYAATPAALMRDLHRAALADPNVARVDDGTRPDYRRYVARTPLLRFPDTIDALARPVADGSALMLYSRSLLGRGDLGANRKRLEAWAARLTSGPTSRPPAVS